MTMARSRCTPLRRSWADESASGDLPDLSEEGAPAGLQRRFGGRADHSTHDGFHQPVHTVPRRRAGAGEDERGPKAMSHDYCEPCDTVVPNLKRHEMTRKHGATADAYEATERAPDEPAPTTTPPAPNVRKGNGAAPTPASAAQPFGGATDNYSLRLPTLMIEKIKGEAAFAKVTPPTVVRAALEMFMALPPSIRGAKLAEMALRVPTKPLILVLARKVVKMTSTSTRLEDTEHPDSAYKKGAYAGRYVLICEVHGIAENDPNREHALAAVYRPWRWCASCKDLLMMEDATS